MPVREDGKKLTRFRDRGVNGSKTNLPVSPGDGTLFEDSGGTPAYASNRDRQAFSPPDPTDSLT